MYRGRFIIYDLRIYNVRFIYAFIAIERYGIIGYHAPLNAHIKHVITHIIDHELALSSNVLR